ncbi:MAG: DUF4926 domain-containing protein [Anaerolineae bacterium]|nr:DUF4926 domain-containing protein [Anaerolineae bacterium]
MIRELDTVVLTHDIAEFEVEFVTAEGKTVALLTLTRADIRPTYGWEVLHVREFAQVAA